MIPRAYASSIPSTLHIATVHNVWVVCEKAGGGGGGSTRISTEINSGCEGATSACTKSSNAVDASDSSLSHTYTSPSCLLMEGA